MRIIRDFDSCPPACKGAVIALGNFDGVHLGHQTILAETIAVAKASGCKPAVMTFEPHPREFFSKTHEKLRIYPLRRKLELLRDCGIELLFLMRFNQQFASLSADAFTGHVLHESLGARHIVTGTNFGFGNKRSGTTALLETQARALGFGFTACPPVHDAHGHTVSSSAVREALAHGNMALASSLLGRPYTIGGRVRRGQQRGRAMGFPTANLSLKKLFKPRLGIYAVRAQVDGIWHDGVASLGINPMFGLPEPLLEVHIFAMDRDLYGTYIEVEPVAYLREERHFGSMEALAGQITQDVQAAKTLLAKQ